MKALQLSYLNQSVPNEQLETGQRLKGDIGQELQLRGLNLTVDASNRCEYDIQFIIMIFYINSESV